MLRKISILGLLIALSVVPFLGGCATTDRPRALSGSDDRPVYNEKGRVVGYTHVYQAR
jgi:hypothetical protein